jgi:hypothetical protein
LPVKGFRLDVQEVTFFAACERRVEGDRGKGAARRDGSNGISVLVFQ